MGQSFEPIIYYWSSNSGGTRRAAEKLTTPTKPIGEVSEVERPFIIMSPSFDQPKGGFTPRPVEKFLEAHGHWLVGVLGAGNLNFGEHYCQAAKDISAQHKVPVLHRIDIMGNEHDYETIDRGVKQHWGTLLNMKGLA